ncbi:MAG: response regulator, partial [Ectothiorhodospiraceae bacterium]
MTTEPGILLVDDDPGLLRLLSIRLQSAGYRVTAVASGEEALSAMAAAQPDVVITDLRMDGMDGLALFQAIHRDNPTLPVIILTAHGSIPDAVEATRNGVFSFVTKPFDSQKLLEQIRSALAVSGGTGNAAVTEDDADWCRDIITRSPVMKQVLSTARMVAGSDASVFIRGDSGTGKELLARAVHRASPRRDGPFIAVNCAAIPEPLLESELLGHRKGSFTGA